MGCAGAVLPTRDHALHSPYASLHSAAKTAFCLRAYITGQAERDGGKPDNAAVGSKSVPTPAIEGSLATIPCQLPHFSAQATGSQPCLLAPEELETRLGLAGSATNHRKLRWALNRAVPGSASPRESKLVLRLSLQASLGGYGLAVAGLNQGLAVAGIASGEGRVRRPDVLLARPGHAEGGRLVALEYDGDVHLDERRHAEDLRRTNELAAAGIAEYRVDKALYKNLGYIDSL